MGKKFEKAFSEPCMFTDGSYHISRNQYDKEAAALEFSSYLGEIIKPEKLKENSVRFQFANEHIKDEMGCTHCWMEVESNTKNAQPAWECPA